MRLIEAAHAKIKLIVKPGDICIDATAGNGYDTLFLAKQIAPNGRVYAFDIQNSAIMQTSARLRKSGLSHLIKLIHQPHQKVTDFIDQKDHHNIKVAMFNLGYLPGTDHRVTTTSKTTICAIENSHNLLKKGGLITIIGYRGHKGGIEETEEVLKLCKLKNWQYEAQEGNSNPLSPVLLYITKN